MRKNRPKKVYAMKVAFKGSYPTDEAEIGKLGKNCHFLVETKAAFASKVNLSFILKIINNSNLGFKKLQFK